MQRFLNNVIFEKSFTVNIKEDTADATTWLLSKSWN